MRIGIEKGVTVYNVSFLRKTIYNKGKIWYNISGKDKVKKYEYQKTCPDDVDEYVLVKLVYAPNRYYIKYSSNDFKTKY